MEVLERTVRATAPVNMETATTRQGLASATWGGWARSATRDALPANLDLTAFTPVCVRMGPHATPALDAVPVRKATMVSCVS